MPLSVLATRYLNLHAAEVLLVELLPEDQIAARIPDVLAHLQTLETNDQYRLAVEGLRLDKLRPGKFRRAAYANALRWHYAAADLQHVRVRSFQNIIVAVTVLLSVLTAIVCLVGVQDPEAVPLCFNSTTTTTAPTTTQAPPTEPTTTEPTTDDEDEPEQTTSTLGTQVCPTREPAGPRGGDVALVALFGTLGGALAAAVAASDLRGTSTPYAVPAAMLLLKLPSGALTAIVGILLVRANFIPGLSQLDSQPQILAYAFFFGYAQQVLTRLVDRQGQQILDKVPSRDAPAENQRPRRAVRSGRKPRPASPVHRARPVAD